MPERTSSSAWVKGVAEMFASQGVDVPRLFSVVGIEMSLLDNGGARLQADKVTELWERAVAWSGKATLGLDRELASRHVNFDVVGYAMLSSPDLRTGLKNFARYLALISDAATFELQPAGGGAWLVLGHTGNTLRVPRQRQEYGLLALLMLCRWLTRREIRPLAAEFIFPVPVDFEPYRRAFECPLRFGQAATRLLLPEADLAAVIPPRNPSMYALHERVMEQRLASLGNARTSYRVSGEIIRRLHRGEPRREDIASSLAMADRTLQRRLHAENTSFQELLDSARRELARKYLADENHSLCEVADLLGFVDQSNFFRAFKRWFGVPPGQYRKRLASEREALAG
jgi:AraC-like DNA-binding protein